MARKPPTARPPLAPAPASLPANPVPPDRASGERFHEDAATTTLRGIERADIGLTDANATKLADLLGISAEEYRASYQRARQRPPGTTA